MLLSVVSGSAVGSGEARAVSVVVLWAAVDCGATGSLAVVVVALGLNRQGGGRGASSPSVGPGVDAVELELAMFGLALILHSRMALFIIGSNQRNDNFDGGAMNPDAICSILGVSFGLQLSLPGMSEAVRRAEHEHAAI
jgi:hypothetical protein